MYSFVLQVIEQDHDERTYQDFQQKKQPINFIVNLKEFHCVKEVSTVNSEIIACIFKILQIIS